MKLVKTIKHHTIAEHEGFFYIYDELGDFDIDMSDGVPSRWSVDCPTPRTEAEAACDFVINHDDHRLTEHQAAVLTAFTGLMMCEFSVFRAYAEKLLGRAINVKLDDNPSVKAELKELSRKDFLKLKNF